MGLQSARTFQKEYFQACRTSKERKPGLWEVKKLRREVLTTYDVYGATWLGLTLHFFWLEISHMKKSLWGLKKALSWAGYIAGLQEKQKTNSSEIKALEECYEIS